MEFISFIIYKFFIKNLPISLESGNGICDMVEKRVSLDILSVSNKFSQADHSNVSSSLFCGEENLIKKKKKIKAWTTRNILIIISYFSCNVSNYMNYFWIYSKCHSLGQDTSNFYQCLPLVSNDKNWKCLRLVENSYFEI